MTGGCKQVWAAGSGRGSASRGDRRCRPRDAAQCNPAGVTGGRCMDAQAAGNRYWAKAIEASRSGAAAMLAKIWATIEHRAVGCVWLTLQRGHAGVNLGDRLSSDHELPLPSAVVPDTALQRSFIEAKKWHNGEAVDLRRAKRLSELRRSSHEQMLTETRSPAENLSGAPLSKTSPTNRLSSGSPTRYPPIYDAVPVMRPRRYLRGKRTWRRVRSSEHATLGRKGD